MSGLNPGTVGAIVLVTKDQLQARRLGIHISTREIKSLVSFFYIACPQGVLRLSGPSSGQGAGGEARTRDRRVPADLRGDSLAIVLPTLREVKKKFFKTSAHAALCKLITGF
ncbi:hypothetical protein PoB_000609800 [Plakobranchus ocellatus]|uniref:Uncharacterized protein n=1 Tax=Plakobranchus ocellatus TaxID=259542 RepID=A0AAV3YAQ4_9GAST|nr:hypothetical protein PoB_000609800 [Plakobranchus ocellatus]